jgi:protein translocase, SecG subunit
MLYGLLSTIFVFICFFLILLVLVQKGKGSAGIGSMGGGTQMLFGGSGGQDIFQKITWICGAIFLGGTLVLTVMKNASLSKSRYLSHMKINAPQQVAPEATAPAETAAAPEATSTSSEQPE